VPADDQEVFLLGKRKRVHIKPVQASSQPVHNKQGEEDFTGKEGPSMTTTTTTLG
jgi:hypothetical protein